MSSKPENDRPSAESRFQAAADVVWRRVEDSIIVVHLRTNKTYELNRTGGRLWELLEGGSNYGDALVTLRAEFDVSDEELRSEASELIALLLDERLAEEAHPS